MDKTKEIVNVKMMICPNCKGRGYVVLTDEFEDIVRINCSRCMGTGETIDESKN